MFKLKTVELYARRCSEPHGSARCTCHQQQSEEDHVKRECGGDEESHTEAQVGQVEQQVMRLFPVLA